MAKMFCAAAAASVLLIGSGAYAANLIPNGGFDDGLTGWNSSGVGLAAIENEGGNSVAHVTAGDPSFPLYTNWITPAPGDQGAPYIAYVDVKLGSFDGTKQTYIQMETRSVGTAIVSIVSQDELMLSDGQWHRISWPVTLDANDFRLVTYAEVGGSGTRDVFFDNFYLGAVPEPTAMGLIGAAALLSLRRRRRNEPGRSGSVSTLGKVSRNSVTL